MAVLMPHDGYRKDQRLGNKSVHERTIEPTSWIAEPFEDVLSLKWLLQNLFFAFVVELNKQAFKAKLIVKRRTC